MAFLTGKSAYFNLDTSGGTPTDLSAYTNSIDPSETLETGETTCFGKSAKTYVASLKDATFSVSGPWDPTLEAHMDAILTSHPASLTFVLGPQGSTSTQRRISGECLLTSYSGQIPVGDVITWTADFQVTDTVTRDTF